MGKLLLIQLKWSVSLNTTVLPYSVFFQPVSETVIGKKKKKDFHFLFFAVTEVLECLQNKDTHMAMLKR